MEEKQVFKLSDQLASLTLITIVLLSVFGIIYKNFADPQIEHTKKKAITIGKQLSIGGLHSLERLDLRGPASTNRNDLKTVSKLGAEGRISKDPWGHSYHFAFLKNDKGAYTKVAVWSSGPNGKFETTKEYISQVREKKDDQELFQGDDIGFINSF